MPRSQPGNKKATKLKNAAVRQEAFRQYCSHLANGYPKEAFFFDYSSYSCCYKTIESYIKDAPIEFPPILIAKAKAARYLHWFLKGEAMADGKVKGNYSPQVWQTIMRNMFREYGWDAPDSPEANKPQEHMEVIIQKIKDAANDTQSEAGNEFEGSEHPS